MAGTIKGKTTGSIRTTKKAPSPKGGKKVERTVSKRTTTRRIR